LARARLSDAQLPDDSRAGQSRTIADWQGQGEAAPKVNSHMHRWGIQRYVRNKSIEYLHNWNIGDLGPLPNTRAQQDDLYIRLLETEMANKKLEDKHQILSGKHEALVAYVQQHNLTIWNSLAEIFNNLNVTLALIDGSQPNTYAFHDLPTQSPDPGFL
jgi:hypothetical protein